ncbi:MAG: Na+/H+ antiporter subunit E [Lachnospiraceae bacterium]|nr:Na+/H+ antiporter subunit E [Lachnospiraceae bacterium]
MIIFFFLVWVIFNGRLTVEIAVFGLVISSAIYMFVCKFLGYSPKIDRYAIRNTGLFVKYFCILMAEIIKANFTATRFIGSSRYEVEPVIVSFETDLKTRSARVLLANSITLTPGTITVSMDGNRFTVHCLDKSLAVGLADSVFVKMLHELESRISEPDLIEESDEQ